MFCTMLEILQHIQKCFLVQNVVHVLKKLLPSSETPKCQNILETTYIYTVTWMEFLPGFQLLNNQFDRKINQVIQYLTPNTKCFLLEM